MQRETIIHHRTLLSVAIGGLLAAGCATTTTRTAETADPAAPRGVQQYVAGAQAYSRGDTATAEATLRRAVSDNPELIAARDLLGDLYRRSGSYEQAAEQYKVLTALDPYGPQNHYKLGLSYHFLRRIQDAIDSYKRSLAIDADYAPASMSLGAAYLSQGQTRDAIANLEHATKLTPDSAASWANYALALDSDGQYTRAESAYRTALELDDQPSTRLNFANNLTAQRRSSEAVAVLESVLARTESPLARKRLGDAYAIGGQFKEALAAYTRAIELNPRYTIAINALASMLIDQYRAGAQLNDELREQAVELWKRSLKIDANQKQVQQLVDAWGNTSVFRN